MTSATKTATTPHDLDGSDVSEVDATIDDSAVLVGDNSGLVADIAQRTRTLLVPVWRDRRLGFAIGIGSAGLWGIVAGWWTPRSPLTTSTALWSMAISVAIGIIAGLVMRSRLAMLSTPLAFAVLFELSRLGSDGPTVDAPAFSTYGILALAVGRGFHGLVSLLPMLLGAAIGAGFARSLRGRVDQPAGPERRPIGRYMRRGVAVLTGVGLLALAAGLARPARTDAIIGPDGGQLEGSVAELITLDVNGSDQTLMIRGYDVDNPVLLFLAGGPGGSELGAMRRHLPELEQHVTVATWDQRGTGHSYPSLDPTSTLTLDSIVDDTLGVTDYLRNRFGQDTIYLAGQSWGSTLGVLAAQRAPEKYTAFIGVGQMVSQLATDRIFYDDTLAWARANDHGGLVDELVDIGPPPYTQMLDYETALSYEHQVYPYDHTGNAEGEGGFSENFLVEEYALIDQVHLLGAFMDTFSVVYPQLQDIDFRETATEFDIPMYFVQGAHEADGRAEVFDDWYPTVDAPVKDLVVLDTSGHRPLFEQPDEFVDYLVDTVLPAAPATDAEAAP
jgi:pimeloyl-ACP methyl ester carboxylesterase